MAAARGLALALLALSGWQWSGAALIHAKATLAPILIARAWQQTLESGPAKAKSRATIRPWSWADTWPVARLRLPARAIDLYVLAGANGASLPFGPGHLTGSALPDDPGTIVIAGHRDTHFAFLDRLSAGELILLQSRTGKIRRFRVTYTETVNAERNGLTADTDRNRLVLITCLQAGLLSFRGPYRLVVTAREE